MLVAYNFPERQYKEIFLVFTKILEKQGISFVKGDARQWPHISIIDGLPKISKEEVQEIKKALEDKPIFKIQRIEVLPGGATDFVYIALMLDVPSQIQKAFSFLKEKYNITPRYPNLKPHSSIVAVNKKDKEKLNSVLDEIEKETKALMYSPIKPNQVQFWDKVGDNYEIVDITEQKIIDESAKKLKRDIYLKVNKMGMEHKKTQNYVSFYTPALDVAYELGHKGIDLSKQPDVIGYRYGKHPPTGISQNYRDKMSEKGLSLSNLEGEDEVGSSIFFKDRKKYKYNGLLLPYKGSDGENLILPYDLELWDNIEEQKDIIKEREVKDIEVLLKYFFNDEKIKHDDKRNIDYKVVPEGGVIVNNKLSIDAYKEKKKNTLPLKELDIGKTNVIVDMRKEKDNQISHLFALKYTPKSWRKHVLFPEMADKIVHIGAFKNKDCAENYLAKKMGMNESIDLFEDDEEEVIPHLINPSYEDTKDLMDFNSLRAVLFDDDLYVWNPRRLHEVMVPYLREVHGIRAIKFLESIPLMIDFRENPTLVKALGRQYNRDNYKIVIDRLKKSKLKKLTKGSYDLLISDYHGWVHEELIEATLEEESWAKEVGQIKSELGELDDIYKDFDSIYNRLGRIGDIAPQEETDKIIKAIEKVRGVVINAEDKFRQITDQMKAPSRSPIKQSTPIVDPKREMERISTDIGRLSVRVRNIGQSVDDFENVKVSDVAETFEKASEQLRKVFVKFEKLIPESIELNILDEAKKKKKKKLKTMLAAFYGKGDGTSGATIPPFRTNMSNTKLGPSLPGPTGINAPQFGTLPAGPTSPMVSSKDWDDLTDKMIKEWSVNDFFTETRANPNHKHHVIPSDSVVINNTQYIGIDNANRKVYSDGDNYFVWDSAHGDWEVFSKRKYHKGSIRGEDFESKTIYKNPVNGRKLNVK